MKSLFADLGRIALLVESSTASAMTIAATLDSVEGDIADALQVIEREHPMYARLERSLVKLRELQGRQVR